jgi:hypothetical protein
VCLHIDDTTGAETIGMDIPKYVQARLQERGLDLPPVDSARRREWLEYQQQAIEGYTSEAETLRDTIKILPEAEGTTLHSSSPEQVLMMTAPAVGPQTHGSPPAQVRHVWD